MFSGIEVFFSRSDCYFFPLDGMKYFAFLVSENKSNNKENMSN